MPAWRGVPEITPVDGVDRQSRGQPGRGVGEREAAAVGGVDGECTGRADLADLRGGAVIVTCGAGGGGGGVVVVVVVVLVGVVDVVVVVVVVPVTDQLNTASPTDPAASVAATVTVKEPAVVGVPEITPVADRSRARRAARRRST